MEEKTLEVSDSERLRLQSLSPELEPESVSECVSLEAEVNRDLMMSPVESGRRSTQGIPEVERNVKFSHPDIRSSGKKSPAQAEVGVTKNSRKSSTLSLHAVAGAREQEQEPLLQRRNSIHNVPFVDVNDPDTRTRMERYKEERRSMLRAKYKAEDYLSTTFARKKKVSISSSQDSCEGDNSSVIVRSNKSISVSPPDSPGIADNNIQPPLLRKISTPEKETSPQTSPIPQTPPSSFKISRKKIDLKKTEQIMSRAPSEERPNRTPDSVIYKTQVIASVQKPSVPSLMSRPDELAISSFNKSYENNTQNLGNTRLLISNRSSASPLDNKISPAPTEDNVNVKERASIFGPRKFSESKVRTVSAPVTESKSFINKTSSANINMTSNRQTSPSKIKNMAALFEQKN